MAAHDEETAVLGYRDLDMATVIDRVQPDVIAVGYDQDSIEAMAKNAIEERGLKIDVKRISRFAQDDLDSSSKIKRKIVEDLGSSY